MNEHLINNSLPSVLLFICINTALFIPFNYILTPKIGTSISNIILMNMEVIYVVITM